MWVSSYILHSLRIRALGNSLVHFHNNPPHLEQRMASQADSSWPQVLCMQPKVRWKYWNCRECFPCCGKLQDFWRNLLASSFIPLSGTVEKTFSLWECLVFKWFGFIVSMLTNALDLLDMTFSIITYLCQCGLTNFLICKVDKSWIESIQRPPSLSALCPQTWMSGTFKN